MDELFQELLEAGTRDSSGVFTLDLANALRKLSSRALDPQRWVLAMVSAAVLSGASCLRVRVDLDDVELEWDGVGFESGFRLSWRKDRRRSPRSGGFEGRGD